MNSKVEFNDDVFEQGIIRLESQLDQYKTLVMADLEVQEEIVRRKGE